MSQALWNEVQELKHMVQGFQRTAAAITQSLDLMSERMGQLEEERRAHWTKLGKQGDKIDSLWLLKEQIERDCARFLEKYQSMIDVSKIKMPETLKKMGFHEDGTRGNPR